MPSRVFEILDLTAEIHLMKVLRVINLLFCSEFAQSQLTSS